MIYIGLIISGLLLIILLIMLIVTILQEDENSKKDVFVDGGYNIETGLREDLSGKIFVGANQESADTYLMQESGKSSHIIVNIYNLNQQQKYQYTDQAEIYVGRDVDKSNEKNYLYIGGDSAISKTHLRILADVSGIFVEDMNSSNHTYVNGRKIRTRVKIDRGDIVKIGRTKLKIER